MPVVVCHVCSNLLRGLRLSDDKSNEEEGVERRLHANRLRENCVFVSVSPETESRDTQMMLAIYVHTRGCAVPSHPHYSRLKGSALKDRKYESHLPPTKNRV